MTSDPNDAHLAEDGVLFVDRSPRGMHWNCSALEDTHNTYCVAGLNRYEDDHLRARWIFCPCQSCRPPKFDFEHCQLQHWLGDWSDHSISYISRFEASAKADDLQEQIGRFASTIKARSFVVVGMSARAAKDDAFAKDDSKLRYSIVQALDEPWVTTKRITSNVDGVIPVNSWACEIRWFKRIGVFDFVPDADDNDDGVRVINLESCVLIEGISLEERSEGVFSLNQDDHRGIGKRNLGRFSSNR